MAEFIVSFVVERLGELLMDEAGTLFEVREQVEWLQNELKRMQSFLKDADAKQDRDERVRNWVSEIKYLANKAEDVIDTFILKEEEEKTESGRGFMALLQTKKRKIFDKRMIGKEIEGIRTRIKDISDGLIAYGITNVGGGGMGTSSAKKMLRLLRCPIPNGDEEDIVGFEDDIKTLVAQLVSEEQRRRVISIVGMGGLGKTTLARKLYNFTDIKYHFPCRAWVYVSQEYKTTDVLQRIIKSFGNPTREGLEMMDRMTEEDLESYVFAFLEQHRYLLVIDDIWDTYAWESLKRALPDKRTGSRVILTTRNRNVALDADEKSPPHDLQFLSNEESWKLFCKKAFPNNASASCPIHLECLGRKMIEKCGGLPLAITVLGALMSRKAVVYEWQRVLDHIDVLLMTDQNKISRILALSYYDLPYQLKPCFLYVGLFPEDSEIDVTKFIQLWLAEGLIPQGGETMEDVAEDYLNELIDRCMIQVACRSNDGLRVEKCRIHDLLRDLSILKAKEENFLDQKNGIFTPSAKLRRQAIHSITEQPFPLSLDHSSPHQRSLLIFGTFSMFEFNFMGFELLRVLHLEYIDADSYSLPDAIGKLIHLRYLGLNVTGSIMLPPSIGNLRSLQTLDLVSSNEYSRPKIPNVIWKMTKLRNLHLKAGFRDETLQIHTLTNLRSLFTVYADVWMRNDLVNLTNLRRLRISQISSSHGEVFSASIGRLSSLRFLSLFAKCTHTFPTLIPLTSCHCLHELSLLGEILEPYEFPPNLTYLWLSYSELKQDPMAKLEKLPNLRFLQLRTHSYEGKQMFCFGGGFPQLQHLQLQGLKNLEEWIVEEGAMPCLRCLEIRDCGKLKMVPEGLRFITTLRELKILRMPAEFTNRIREVGEDFYKVRHIPSITFRE